MEVRPGVDTKGIHAQEGTRRGSGEGGVAA
jgi:hypothetical protein